MDESGNNNPAQSLIVGGLAIDQEYEEFERNLAELYQRYAAQVARFGSGESFNQFLDHGFHGGQMPVEIQMALVEHLSISVDFKIFMIFSDRSRMPEISESERIILLYSKLLSDVIIRFRQHPKIIVRIETNEELRPHLSRLESSIIELAAGRSRAPIRAQISIEMIDKTAYHAMGVIDFYMHTVSTWIASQMVRDSANFAYRNLAALESKISLLSSFEGRVLSSRTARISS